jgi:hypothetical protein
MALGSNMIAWPSRRTRSARPNRGDAGVTLVELLIVLVIMPLVIGSIAFVFVTTLQDQGAVSKSISDSADSQVVSTYYTPDIQSATEFTTDSAAPGQCGSPGTMLLGLEWDGYTPTSGIEDFQTVVSYDVVPTGSTYSLLRYYCSSGTLKSATTISSDISATQVPPTIAPVSVTTYAKAGWIPVQGCNGVAAAPPGCTEGTLIAAVTGITFALTEPGSSYQYSLTADPASGQPGGTGGTPSTPSSGCGFAVPTTGTYASNLCVGDFATVNMGKAETDTAPACQKGSEGISGTPFTLNYCLRWVYLGGAANGSTCTAPLVFPQCALAQVALPTYASPPVSEAFLGTNGFYTGVPGKPALYTQAEGSKVEIFMTGISVTDSTGQSATGWELVTGDAESTDSGESITWSTCPGLTTPSYSSKYNNSSTTIPFGVSTGSGCVASGTGMDPNLTLLDNSPSSPFGNACADDAVTTGSSPNTTPASFSSGVYLTGVGTTSVECGADVDSDKTGTVMLEAAAPSTLSVYLNGTGLQAAFIGVYLP